MPKDSRLKFEVGVVGVQSVGVKRDEKACLGYIWGH